MMMKIVRLSKIVWAKWQLSKKNAGDKNTIAKLFVSQFSIFTLSKVRLLYRRSAYFIEGPPTFSLMV